MTLLFVVFIFEFFLLLEPKLDYAFLIVNEYHLLRLPHLLRNSAVNYVLFCSLGLVDTAVKTAETGYMQRRLVKVSYTLFMRAVLLEQHEKATTLF